MLHFLGHGFWRSACSNATLFIPEASTALSKDPKLEKNYLLALVLCFAVLFFYPVFLKWLSPPSTTTSEDVEQAVPERSLTGIKPSAMSPPEEPILVPLDKLTIIGFQNQLYEVKLPTLGASVLGLSYLGSGEVKQPSELLSQGEEPVV